METKCSGVANIR